MDELLAIVKPCATNHRLPLQTQLERYLIKLLVESQLVTDKHLNGSIIFFLK